MINNETNLLREPAIPELLIGREGKGFRYISTA